MLGGQNSPAFMFLKYTHSRFGDEKRLLLLLRVRKESSLINFIRLALCFVLRRGVSTLYVVLIDYAMNECHPFYHVFCDCPCCASLSMYVPRSQTSFALLEWYITGRKEEKERT